MYQDVKTDILQGLTIAKVNITGIKLSKAILHMCL